MQTVALGMHDYRQSSTASSSAAPSLHTCPEDHRFSGTRRFVWKAECLKMRSNVFSVATVCLVEHTRIQTYDRIRAGRIVIL